MFAPQERLINLINLARRRKGNKLIQPPMAMLKTKPRPEALINLKAKVAPRKVSRMVATTQPRFHGASPRGRLHVGATTFTCAIGAASISHCKREGDFASPAGQFRLLQGFFKPGTPRPLTRLSLRYIDKTLGWCDDPDSPTYNRLIRLPSHSGHEAMWRDDGLYELVIVLDYNIAPRRKHRGSAIFLHCAGADFAPTAGCIALRAGDLRKLVPRLARDAVIILR